MRHEKRAEGGDYNGQALLKVSKFHSEQNQQKKGKTGPDQAMLHEKNTTNKKGFFLEPV